MVFFFFVQAEDGIRDLVRSRGLGDVYKRQVRALVECEFNLPDFRGLGDFTRIHVHTGGRELPAQVEQELSNVPVEWRKRIVFPAELAPGRMSRFDCTMEPLPSKPPLRLRARGGKIVFTTKDLQVIVNTRTGLILSLIHI